MGIQVGREAPDFTARAYHDREGKGHQAFRLPRQMGDALFLSWRLHLCLTDRTVGSCRQVC